MMAILSRQRRAADPKRFRSLSPLESALFPTNGPLPPDDLIGRSAEVSALIQALTHGEHQALTGPRKTGTTSVARAAVAALEDEGWDSVTVDLFHIGDVAALVDRLVKAATQHAEARRQLAEGQRPTSVGEALGLLQRVAEAGDRRMVLLVDGLQELATTQLFGKPDDLTKEMRAVLDRATRVACLFVGTVPYLMQQLFTSKEQGFYQFGSVVSLSPISTASWHAGLRPRFMEGGCDIDDVALDRLVELSDGHPRSTMLIAHWVYGLAQAGDVRKIHHTLVEEGLRVALAGQRAVHDSELARVRTLGKHTLGITLRVAKGESAYKDLPPAIARQTLRSLETAGIVRHPRSGAWRIVDPLFREFLLRTIEDTPDNDTTADITAATEAIAGPAEHPPSSFASAPSKGDPTGATIGGETALDAAHLSFRHPHPEEANAVGQLVAHVIASRGNGPRATTASTKERAGDSDQSTGRRFGRFIERTVAHRPDWYWQLETNGRAVGGLVLYQPRALIGPRTSSGIDPLAQLGLLALVVAFALTGGAILVAREAWTWGGLGGFLSVAFIACLIQAVLLGKEALGRARASWIARRHKGTVFEGLWNEPEVMPTVFQALARQFPGTLLTTHAATPDRVAAYRSIGFRSGRAHVVAGVLDPAAEPPVRAEEPNGTLRSSSSNGQHEAPTQAPDRTPKPGSGARAKNAPGAKKLPPSGKKRQRSSGRKKGPRGGGRASRAGRRRGGHR